MSFCAPARAFRVHVILHIRRVSRICGVCSVHPAHNKHTKPKACAAITVHCAHNRVLACVTPRKVRHVENCNYSIRRALARVAFEEDREREREHAQRHHFTRHLALSRRWRPCACAPVWFCRCRCVCKNPPPTPSRVPHNPTNKHALVALVVVFLCGFIVVVVVRTERWGLSRTRGSLVRQ